MSIASEMSRGFTLCEDDDWYVGYAPRLAQRIRDMANVFPQVGIYFGESVPEGPREGALIPKGKTLEELCGKNMLAQFSIPSSTTTNKSYSVWLKRPRENEQRPHKMCELFVSCSCMDHCNMIKEPGYVVGTPCLHGASVAVALSRLASTQLSPAGCDPHAPDAWTTISPSLRSQRATASKNNNAQNARKAEEATAVPELGKRTGPSRAKSRASASNSRSISLSRARKQDERLPYSCGRCGFESRVELTECEGECGKRCCGRCTAEQLSAEGTIALLCVSCRSAMTLSQAAPSAKSYTDMETAEGRVFMLRQKLHGIRERSKSPLEPWALNVAKETVLKCERVVSMSTEHVPDEVVDELLSIPEC